MQRFIPLPRRLGPGSCEVQERPDIKRPVVTDAWACSLASGAAAGSPLYGSGVANQLLVTADADIVAAIVANAGFSAEQLSNAEGALNAQLQDRTVTALRAEIHVQALEGVDDGAGGYDYLYNIDLSRAIETALQRVNLVVYDSNSSVAGLQATPLYSFEGGIQLEDPLTVDDEDFHAELTAPSNLPVINPSHPTKVHWEIRIEALVENGDAEDAGGSDWSI